jgi:hypothetical protein
VARGADECGRADGHECAVGTGEQPVGGTSGPARADTGSSCESADGAGKARRQWHSIIKWYVLHLRTSSSNTFNKIKY